MATPPRVIGLITYQAPHLKTEQVLLRLRQKPYAFRLYALPFKPRKPREVRFAHRPPQHDAVPPHELAERHGIPYRACDRDTDIDGGCDLYLILGANLLSPEGVAGKRILNCHPGILPAVRGLDAFKWAVLEMKPLGVTLHYIDARVDAGEIVAVVGTDVYASDTLGTLARRHYENEVDCLVRFDEFLLRPVNAFRGLPVDEPRRRMPLDVEARMEAAFPAYRDRYGRPDPPFARARSGGATGGGGAGGLGNA